jgi:hypothetical protein
MYVDSSCLSGSLASNCRQKLCVGKAFVDFVAVFFLLQIPKCGAISGCSGDGEMASWIASSYGNLPGFKLVAWKPREVSGTLLKGKVNWVCLRLFCVSVGTRGLFFVLLLMELLGWRFELQLSVDLKILYIMYLFSGFLHEFLLCGNSCL